MSKLAMIKEVAVLVTTPIIFLLKDPPEITSLLYNHKDINNKMKSLAYILNTRLILFD